MLQIEERGGAQGHLSLRDIRLTDIISVQQNYTKVSDMQFWRLFALIFAILAAVSMVAADDAVSKCASALQ